ncbi:MAG TPA: hypothetical protein VFK11_01235 [Candidatus Saccharimonadales bacterium]|nr:hypothetical protein [Candidatus Saccharimonadales bacterium]
MPTKVNVETVPSFPSIVMESGRPGATEEDQPLKDVKKLVLNSVINNAMRKHGAEAVACEEFDEVDVKGVTGSELSVIGASRAEPPMSASEALEIGSDIYERWQEISGDLPGFCDTIHYVPVEITRNV